MNKVSFGFPFWLAWIFWFAFSLAVAALFWTGLLTWQFGKIQGPELTFSWALAVFGSWFILVIPFMRKKERIWKRLNDDQEKATDAWLQAMLVFIGLLVASSVGWSFVFRGSLSQGTAKGFNPLWAKSVFATWLLILLPFLTWMYRRADEIFKSAVIRQTQAGPRFKTVFIEKSKRLLPEKIADKLKTLKPTLENGHIVTLSLKDGSEIADVFVLNSSEILGLYDRQELGFNTSDIIDAELKDPDFLPVYEESKWLRLDGRA